MWLAVFFYILIVEGLSDKPFVSVFFSFLNTQLNGVSTAQGFGIEFLLTLQLVLCVIATTDKRRRDVSGSAPLAIGLSVGLGHLGGVSARCSDH